MTGASLTSVTATPGTGVMPQRLTNTKWALPAPTRTTDFSIGTAAVEFIGSALRREARAAPVRPGPIFHDLKNVRERDCPAHFTREPATEQRGEREGHPLL